MNEVFKNATGFTVIFMDDGIAYMSSHYIKYYPYGSIQKIGTSLGCLVITDKEKADNGKNKASIFAYNGKIKNRIKELIKFAEKQMATAKPAKAEDKEIGDDDISLPKEVEEAIALVTQYKSKEVEETIALATQYKSMEYRKRCNVCGKIFCYTAADLNENKSNAGMAALSSFGALASALGGTAYHTFENNKQADRYSSKIVDYNKCPNCNSTNLSTLSEEEFEAMQKTQAVATPAATSAADEIKKFKELLDMGIITQEEFDAKKKQLLGL